MTAARNESNDVGESLVAGGVVIVGDLAFCGGLRIDGEVRGDVRAAPGRSATLIVGEHGRVTGSIEVTRVVIHGAVSGHVFGSERVELRPTARVDGDLAYTAVEIHPGAILQGRLLHRQGFTCHLEAPAIRAA